MAPLACLCVALAAASLMAPSEASFDPWAWLVWGREIAHLSLDTTAGPSWKPLPVVFTTLFAPLSAVDDELPPALWMVIARAGGLLAVVLAAKVAADLAGGGTGRRVVAGGVASVALVLTPDWIRYLFHGSEAPLSVGLALLAVERHLAQRRDAAFVLGAIACLARPELFPFLLLYGAHLAWGSPESRVVVALALVVVPALWLMPSWVGSGDPLAAGTQARSEPSWSLSLTESPWRAALEVAQRQAWLTLELLALAAVALALLGRSRDSVLPCPARPRYVTALACFGLAVVALFTAMTEAGFSGNPRYVLPGVAAIAIVGGVGAGLAIDLGRGLAERRLSPAWSALGAAAAGAVLVVAAAPELRAHVGAARAEGREAVERSRLHEELTLAVDTVGAGYVSRFGPATTNRSFQTHLAWELKVPVSEVHGTGGRGIVFRAPAQPVAGVVRIYPRARRRLDLARVGSWRVTTRPPNARHVFTWPILGFSLRAAAARYGGRGPV